MKRQHVEDYRMLTQVSAFAANNVGLFPKTSAGSEVQTALEVAVQELTDLSTARVSAETSMRSSRNDRAAALGSLKGLLAKAELTARALGSDKYRLPSKPTNRALIDSGRAFAVDIEPLKKDFIQHGFSPADVAVAVDALEQAILAYTGGKAKRSASIKEFDKKLEEAMGYMHRFEALVANTLADNPSAMAEWTVAQNINRVAVRKRRVKPPAPAEPGTPPVEQPAAA